MKNSSTLKEIEALKNMVNLFRKQNRNNPGTVQSMLRVHQAHAEFYAKQIRGLGELIKRTLEDKEKLKALQAELEPDSKTSVWSVDDLKQFHSYKKNIEFNKECQEAEEAFVAWLKKEISDEQAATAIKRTHFNHLLTKMKEILANESASQPKPQV